jgi:hypothetical protein
MSGHGPLAGAACDDGPDDAAGGVVPGVAADEPEPEPETEPEPEPEPDGATVTDGVVVPDPVAAVATPSPSPRARPTELPTIAAATNIRLCLMVLLRGRTGRNGPGVGDGPTTVHSTMAPSQGSEGCLRIPAESEVDPQGRRGPAVVAATAHHNGRECGSVVTG